MPRTTCTRPLGAQQRVDHVHQHHADGQAAVLIERQVRERLTGWVLESKGFIEQMHAAAHTLYRLECRSQRRSCGNCGST